LEYLSLNIQKLFAEFIYSLSKLDLCRRGNDDNQMIVIIIKKKQENIQMKAFRFSQPHNDGSRIFN